MNNAQKIVARLEAAGINFSGETPNSAHYCCRGQEPRTWLVRKEVTGRRSRLRECLPWQYVEDDLLRASGWELTLDQTAASLARAECIVAMHDNWSSALNIATFEGWARQRQLLLPARVVTSHWRTSPTSPRPLLLGHSVRIPEPGERAYWSGIVVGIPDNLREYSSLQDVHESGYDPEIQVRILRNDADISTHRLSELDLTMSEQLV